MADRPQFSEFTSGPLSWNDLLKKIEIKSKIRTAYSKVSQNILADLFALLERYDLRVAEMYLNPNTYSEMRKWGGCFDPETRKENIQKGILGMIWGADIVVNLKVPDQMILAVSSKDSVTSGVLLNLGEKTFKGSDTIMGYIKRLDSISSEVQSMLRRTKQSLEEMIMEIENYQI